MLFKISQDVKAPVNKIENLFNQIILLITKKLKLGIDFKYSISSLAPKSLYSDAIKLKQIII